MSLKDGGPLLPPLGKPSKTSKKDYSAYRFEVKIDLTDKKNYTHVNYMDLVREAINERKKSKEPNKNKQNDPFGDEDEDEEVARIAAKFEKKYGKICGSDGYVDKGEGYDETDPFIDNAEAYDELIPENVTTEYGGFYINTGELKFKAIDEEEGGEDEEDEYEKASMLQKLKRKRNKIEDDSDSEESKKKSKAKYLNSKMIKPVSVVNQSGKPVEQKKQPSKKETSSVSLIEPKRKTNTEPKVKPEPKVKAKPQYPPDESSKRKPTKEITSSTKFQQKSSAHDAVTMAQNLFTQSIHQLITDSLLGNPKGGGNLAIVNSNNNHKNLDNQNEQFSNSTTANSSNVSNVYNLKQSLLNLKMPYEIIQAIPLTNVHGGISHEWNRFLVDVYKKTSNSLKNRQKIFEYLAAYLGYTRDSLLNYTQKISVDPVEVKKFVKPADSQQKAASPVTSSPQNPLNTNSINSGMNLTKKQSSLLQAMNLSTNNNTGASSSTFSEGLAGKLANPANEGNSGSTTGSKQQSSSRSGSMNIKSFTPKSSYINKMKQESIPSSQLSNYAMLQSLATLASSSLGPPVPSSKPSPSQHSMLMSRSSTPPNRNSSPHNPNSLLASMKNTSGGSGSGGTTNPGTTAPTPSTSSANSGRNPDLLSLFQLPNIFNNTNLINQLLNSNTSIAHSDQLSAPAGIVNSNSAARNSVISKSTANSEMQKNSLLASNKEAKPIFNPMTYNPTTSASSGGGGGSIITYNRGNMPSLAAQNIDRRQMPLNSTIIKYNSGIPHSGSLPSNQQQQPRQ